MLDAVSERGDEVARPATLPPTRQSPDGASLLPNHDDPAGIERDVACALSADAFDVVLRCSVDGVVAWVSDSVEAALGRPAAAVVGRPLATLAAPDDAGQVSRALADAVSTGRSLTELRLARHDGWFQIELRARLVSAADDGPAWLAVAWRDVDDDIRLRLRMRAAEEQFVTLAESMVDVVATYDRDWVHTWVSPSVERLLGWDPAELVGKRASVLIHPDDLDDEVAKGDRMLAQRDDSAHRMRMLHKDGSYRWVENRMSFRFEGDRHVGTTIVTRDIDEQVAAEQALERSHARFAEMFRSHQAVMVLVDPDRGLLVEGNEAAARFYGYSVDQLRGMPLDRIDVRPREELFGEFRGILDGTRNTFLAPQRLADGRMRTVEVHVSPIPGEEHHLLFAIERDVTDDVAARAALVASEERYRELVESMTDVMATFDTDAICTWVSPSVTRLLGVEPDTLIGTPLIRERVHPDDLHLARDVVVAATSHGEIEPVRLRLRHESGEYRWVEANAWFRYHDDGSLRGTYAVVRDVDATVRAQAALADSQRHYRLLAENSGDVVLLLDSRGTIQWASPSVTRLNGWDPEYLVGVVALDLAHPDDLPAAMAARENVLAGGIGSFQTRTLCADGRRRWIQVVSRAVRDPVTGEVTSIVTNWRDAEADVAARRELAASEAQFRLAMAHAPIAMMLIGLDGRLIRHNDAVTDMLGYESADLAFLTFDDLMHPDEGGMASLPLRELALGEMPTLSEERRFRTRDGELRWGQLSMTLARNDQGMPSHFIAQLLDVTDIRAAREQLAHRALHDPLTGLANRALFDEHLRGAHERALRHGTTLAVLFCDLDGFKSINDTHGHDVGDTVLLAVAERLVESVRANDLVARLGGDEFVIVAEDLVVPEAVTRLAERIRANVTRPIDVAEGVRIVPATSVGVAIADEGDAPRDLVHHADQALYTAKAAGRNRWVLHGADDRTAV